MAVQYFKILRKMSDHHTMLTFFFAGEVLLHLIIFYNTFH